ncbi:MAG: L-arabinose isomerase, partial [Gemmatimonadota bacterium]
MKPFQDLEVWFVTGSQHLYGPGPLRQVAEDARQIAAGLDGAPQIPARVVYKDIVTRPEEILAVCQAASNDPRCVGLICWMHTFSPAKMWIAGLGTLQRPFMHLHTQYNRDLPWATIDMDFMNLNQSAHGDREFGFICTRLRKPRKVVVGHWREADVEDRLAAWMRAAVGAHEMRNLKVARFGDNMRQVAVTEGDKVEAQVRFGVEVNGYAVGDLAARIRDASDAEVERLLAEYDQRYAMADSLKPGGQRRAALAYAARTELGLRALLD